MLTVLIFMALGSRCHRQMLSAGYNFYYLLVFKIKSYRACYRVWTIDFTIDYLCREENTHATHCSPKVGNYLSRLSLVPPASPQTWDALHRQGQHPTTILAVRPPSGEKGLLWHNHLLHRKRKQIRMQKRDDFITAAPGCTLSLI